jgi:hypothetical protein
MKLTACLALFALAACSPKPPIGIEVRTVEVPTPVACPDPSLIPSEPASVRGRLTGNAVADVLILAESALELRRWGQEQAALLEGCASG